MTTGAVSLTKGEGAGRQAGPAAASAISMAAGMRRSGALIRPRPSRPMVSAARRCGAMCGDRRGVGAGPPAQQEPERRRGAAAPGAASGRRKVKAARARHAGASRGRRRRAGGSRATAEARRRRRARTSSSEGRAAGMAATGVRGRQETVAPSRAPRASIRGVDAGEAGGVLGAVEGAAGGGGDGLERRVVDAVLLVARASGSPTAMVWMTTPFCAGDGGGLGGRHAACRCRSRRRAGSGRGPRPPRPRRSGWRGRWRRRATVFCPAMPGARVARSARAASVSRVKGTRT